MRKRKQREEITADMQKTSRHAATSAATNDKQNSKNAIRMSSGSRPHHPSQESNASSLATTLSKNFSRPAAKKLSSKRFDSHKPTGNIFTSSGNSKGSQRQSAFALEYQRGALPVRIIHGCTRIEIQWDEPAAQSDWHQKRGQQRRCHA